MRQSRRFVKNLAILLLAVFFFHEYLFPNGRHFSAWILSYRDSTAFGVPDFAFHEEIVKYEPENELSQPATLDDTLKNDVLRRCQDDGRHPMDVRRLSSKQKKVLFGHLLVSDQFKFIYCYVPKVACSNWKKTYLLMHGKIKSVLDVPHLDHTKMFKKLSDYSDQEVDKRLNNYFKFAFVRHPLERALSGYRNKFLQIPDFYRKHGPNIISQYHKEREHFPWDEPGDDVSYEDMLRYLSEPETPLKLDEHFTPINQLCQPCAIKYDFIGTYDTINIMSEKILRTVGAPDEVHFPQQQKWYKPTSSNYVTYYHSLVSDEVVEDFYLAYREDFTLFGYSPLNFTFA